MKTKFRHTMRLLSMAALALAGAMMTGCSNEDDAIAQQPQGNRVVTLTTTISLGGGKTRALDATGHKIFAADDQIAIVYKNEDGQTVKAVSNKLIGIGTDISADGKKATITVTLEKPAQNGALRYIYPAAMAKGTIDAGATINDANTINYDALAAQDGTLTTLASSLDLAVYDGTLTGEAALPASVTLTNPLCIGEFTIINADGSSDLTSTITGLWISDGTNTYAVTRTAAEGPIYVAMRPVAATITFAAQTASTYYEREVTGKTLAAGNMYPVGVKMTLTHTVNLARLCNVYTAQKGETLTGKLALCKQISIKGGATVTLNNVDINGDNTFDGRFPGITCNGNATLTLVGTNTVRGCYGNGYPGIYPASGKTLTINGSGKLFAYGNGSSAAGIGGGKSPYLNCGNIKIQSGEITASATSSFGAGIGSSGKAGFDNICGNITITGGTVIATGGYRAAGIGTGCANIGSNKTTTTNRCGNISISGGTVTATGGGEAAGIGLGYTGQGYSNTATMNNICSAITITNGVTRVTAIRGSGATYCIGKGAYENIHTTVTCGTITIGCTLDSDGKPVGGDTYKDGGMNPTNDNTYVYQPSL